MAKTSLHALTQLSRAYLALARLSCYNLMGELPDITGI